MTTQQTYKCPKCNGTGNLSQYAGILGGVCFSCNGAGVKVGTPPVPGKLWAISAVRKADGVRVNVFNVKAKTADAALTKARATLAKGNGYLPESAEVTGEA